MRKKTFLFITSLTVLLFILIGFKLALAATITFNNPASQHESLLDFIIAVFDYLRATVAILAITAIVLAGIFYIISGSTGNEKMNEVAKKTVVGAILGFALVIGAPSFLRQINVIIYESPIAPINQDISTVPTLFDIVSRTLDFMLSIIGILGIIGLTISGIMYLMAAASSGQAEKAKKAMIASIVGIAVAGAGLIIITQIAHFFQ